jgi:glycosyltransferase involved in cell wall biosynthesis
MGRSNLTYALVTPARDEADNLGRLAGCLVAQTTPPSEWLIVENGSTDETLAIAQKLAQEHAWIRVITISESAARVRGGAIVRALVAGIEALESQPDLLVNLDADVSVEPDYFERLVSAFAADPKLGIASGSGFELEAGSWRQLFATRGTVWGATRAYRWNCLQDVWPLEERLGWDGLDELQATVRGWKTTTLLDLPFRHHRPVGQRDGQRRIFWDAEGRLAHYMGYRIGYLIARVAYRAVRERDPAALGMLWGYTSAAIRREPRWSDEVARAHLRNLQRLRNLPARRREALGRGF